MSFPAAPRQLAVFRAFLPLAVCILLLSYPLQVGSVARERLTQRAQLDAQFHQRLEALADKCDELELPAQGQATRQWIVRRDPGRQYLFLPPAADPTRPPAGAPKRVHQWHRRFLEDRRQQAEALFQLAQQALEADRPARAYQLLHEVLREDPDQAEARRILGYRQTSRGWRRPAPAPRARSGGTVHPLFGWHAHQYWRVETEHYRITTNHSAQAGLELGQQLEEFHTVWQQLFFGYWSTQPALAARFAGQNAPLGKSPRHNVVLFRDRQEYVNQLGPSEPQIGISVGYYLDQKRTAFFYVDDSPIQPTWFHEGTHQLFQETGSAVVDVGRDANFWILEGVALYMESLRPHDGYYTVGGFDAERLQYARYRALNEGFYIPLEKLVRYGRQALQKDEDIRRLYSQSAGLASFLMDSDRGRYRPALVDYLRAIYLGRDGPETLALATATPLAELDAQYREFLQVSDADLVHLNPLVQSLALGHTQVTDQGLAHLAGNHAQLQWLDLAATQVTDAGIASLKEAPRLKQLNLESTRITAAALDTLRSLHGLEELDLSGIRLNDADLQGLADLRNLRVLWLTRTGITDAGLEHLTGLKQLEMLDLRGTQVSDQGRQRLEQMLPKLRHDHSNPE